MNLEAAKRKPGRPRAIPETLIPKVLSLYHQGLGYRAVARELKQEGVCADWSTVRRIIKSHKSRIGRDDEENSHQTNSDTILTLGRSADRTSLINKSPKSHCTTLESPREVEHESN